MALQVDIYRVDHRDGFSMPRIALANRRAAGAPTLHWICQRHLEILLFNRTDGGSSGAIWKALSQSGLSSTSLCCSKKAVSDGVLLAAEFTQIMDEFKKALPPEVCDPSSLGRIRFCTLLPLATAAVVCRQHGRSGASMAWLRAFGQPVPESWELREEQEQNAANLQVDLALNDKLEALEAEQVFEVEELSFAEELTTMPSFTAVVDDEERMKTYILNPVPSILKKELDEYIIYRTATFSARRQGAAVQSISAEGDRTALLRFYGYLTRTNRVPEDADLLYLPFMIRADLGDLVERYAGWLQNTQGCRFSTIANYLNGLVSITSYCYANLAPTDAVLQMEPNPLAQIINLRGQAEKQSRTQQMFDRRVGGWLTWEDVQKARLKSFEKLDEAQWSSYEEKRFALRDCAALSLLSLIPPDRVGCIRKLRLGHTLKKKPGGGWMMDLTKQRDGHKTSKFYGPFAASLPEALTPILDEYTGAIELNAPIDGPYLFHPPTAQPDRPLEPSAWSGWVRRLFKRHHGEEVAPKTLRAVFVTWLRNSTDAPEVLKSAAHAMKHAEARQQSGEYDTEKDDRLIKAAFDFNLSFASQYSAEVPTRNGAGSSNAHAAGAAANPRSPRPSRPGKETGMAAARAMASGGVMVAGAVAPAPDASPAPAAPPAAEPSVRRCVFADCKSDTPAEGLRECPCGNGPHHHFCSIAAGCEADESLCAACFGAPVFVLAPAAEEAAAAEEAEEEEAQAPADALVDDEWQPLGGGPWVAKLMRPSRQPVSTATYRNFYVPIAFDPTTTPLVPGGQIKFPIVAGAPPEGIICQLPNSWTARQRSLVFRLKLSKSGATANEVTINSVLYRQMTYATDDDDEEQESAAVDESVPAVVPLAVAPPEMVAAAAEAASDAHAADDALLAHEPPLDAEPPPPAEPIADAPPVDESNGDADAIQAAIRANHLEANIGLPDTVPNAVPTLSSLCREVVCRSSVPLPGEGEAAVEPPSAGDVPAQHADVMGAVAADMPAAADTEDEEDGDDEPPLPAPAPVAYNAQWAATLLAGDASEDAVDEASAPPIAPVAAQQLPNEPRDADQVAMEAEEEEAAEVAAVPMQAEAPALPVAPPVRAAGRERKRKVRFGDNGELDGAARSFRSKAPPPKPTVDPSVDMGVPAYALPGCSVWAMGLHAGTRKRFKATVLKLRKQFPRSAPLLSTERVGLSQLLTPDPLPLACSVVVKYTADESGGTHALELPDPVVAYLTMSDVEPNMLIEP